MANKTNNKPHVKSNPKLLKKPAVSLTNEQNEEIFNAAIYREETHQLQLPAAADSPRNEARSSAESASVKASGQNSQNTTSIVDMDNHLDNSSATPLNSEDFIPIASSSQKTSPLNPWTEELTEEDLLKGPPKFTSRREKLLWLQEQRGTGLYVKCDNSSCGKWRWLTNPDPEDLPRQWFCFMHPDKKFAACNIPEKSIPHFVEDDLIHNCYTTGSIVWAKLTGYPWWPAMVDDCPDTEMYYWINKDGDIVPVSNEDTDVELGKLFKKAFLYGVYKDWYHVVFLDKGAKKNVSRRWVLLKDLKSFKCNPHLDKKYKLKKKHKSRINAAKQIANAALKMSIKERLKKYSFLSLWNKDIPEYTSSDETEVDEEWDEQKVLKKKIIERKKSNRNRRLELKRKELRQTSSDSSNDEICLNENKSDIAENNRTEHTKESVECENLADNCSNINKNLQEEVVEKEETKTENNEEKLMMEVYKRYYSLFTGEMGETKFKQLYKYIIDSNIKSEIKTKDTEMHIKVKKEKNEKSSAEDSTLEPLIKSSNAKEIQIIIKSETEETKSKLNNNDPNLKSLSEDKSEKTNETDSSLEPIIVENKVETSQKQKIKIKRPTEIKNNNDPDVKPISADKPRKIREADTTLEPITKKLKRSFRIPLRKN